MTSTRGIEPVVKASEGRAVERTLRVARLVAGYAGRFGALFQSTVTDEAWCGK